MDEKNLFSIGEMARALDVTRRIILNYEEKGLIYPDKKDGEVGNRYYTVDTMTKARTVRILQKQGLSLTEIRAYLDGQTDLLSLIRRLEKMRDEINLNIEKLYERYYTLLRSYSFVNDRFDEDLFQVQVIEFLIAVSKFRM